MAQKTRLGLSGIPRELYGSFSGKTAAPTHPVSEITRLGLSGIPRQRYGSFAGKTAATPSAGLPHSLQFFITMGPMTAR